MFLYSDASCLLGRVSLLLPNRERGRGEGKLDNPLLDWILPAAVQCCCDIAPYKVITFFFCYGSGIFQEGKAVSMFGLLM